MRILINESQLGVIKEAFSVGLINIITEKFRHTNPDVDEDKIREYIKRFDEIKGSPNVKEKDITKYTFEQILALLHEYDEEGKNDESEDSVFAGGDKKATPERIEASKQLWMGEDYKIIDEGDLRVYAIPDQRVSMNYGYFEQFIARKQGGEQWCVTGRNSSDSRSN